MKAKINVLMATSMILILTSCAAVKSIIPQSQINAGLAYGIVEGIVAIDKKYPEKDILLISREVFSAMDSILAGYDDGVIEAWKIDFDSLFEQISRLPQMEGVSATRLGYIQSATKIASYALRHDLGESAEHFNATKGIVQMVVRGLGPGEVMVLNPEMASVNYRDNVLLL
jgi:hypothetical protein